MHATMPACTDLTYHIVFGTKGAIPALHKTRREDLYHYLRGVARTRGSQLYQAGGVDDHIHLLVGLNPSVALADLVTEMKATSSQWIHRWRVFPAFADWQNGYGAFSIAAEARPALIRHIEHQELHHSGTDFVSELRHLVQTARLRWDDGYLP
jgi:putative transposase